MPYLLLQSNAFLTPSHPVLRTKGMALRGYLMGKVSLLASRVPSTKRMRWPSLQGQAGMIGISWRCSGVMPSVCSLEQQTLLVSQWQLRRSKVWVFPPAEMFAIVPWDPSSPLWNIWSRMGQARHWVLSATSPLSRTWVSGSRGWQPLPLISSTAKCSSFRTHFWHLYCVLYPGSTR